MAPTIQKDSFIKSPFLGVSWCLKGRHLTVTESLVPSHKLTTSGNILANQKGRWGNPHRDCNKDLSFPFSVKSHRQQKKGCMCFQPCDAYAVSWGCLYSCFCKDPGMFAEQGSPPRGTWEVRDSTTKHFL